MASNRDGDVDLLFAAERANASDSWRLTHVSLHPADQKLERLAQAGGEPAAARATVRQLIDEEQSVPLPSRADRRR